MEKISVATFNPFCSAVQTLGKLGKDAISNDSLSIILEHIASKEETLRNPAIQCIRKFGRQILDTDYLTLMLKPCEEQKKYHGLFALIYTWLQHSAQVTITPASHDQSTTQPFALSIRSTVKNLTYGLSAEVADMLREYIPHGVALILEHPLSKAAREFQKHCQKQSGRTGRPSEAGMCARKQVAPSPKSKCVSSGSRVTKL